MIGLLKGIVDSITTDSLLLDVNGVGYHVHCSANTLRTLPSTGEAAKLYIETHVREDHIHLYGFHNTEEQQAFQTLTRVSGVGARMGLAILSVLSPAQLSTAIAAQDKKAFTSVSGVGPKLAGRILNELKDKFVITANSAEFAGTADDASAASSNNNAIQDTILALTQLGYSRSDAYQAAQKVAMNDQPLAINEMIRESLKLLSNG
jgi:Holliday junction DNA helicase RuvA